MYSTSNLNRFRNELEQLYKELGCTVINITEDINDSKIANDDIIQDIFLTKVYVLFDNMIIY